MEKKIRVKVEGIAPLLMNRFQEERPDSTSVKHTGVRDYSQEVENALYRSEDKQIYIPSVWFEQSTLKASSNFRIPGKGHKTYKDLVNSALIITPEEIVISPQEFTVDRRSVVIQRSRVFRRRPRWNKWQCEFIIHLFDEQLRPEVVKSILEFAGAYGGVGDYRPKFGRFKIAEWNELEK